MSNDLYTRRRAAAKFTSWLADSPASSGGHLMQEPPGRLAPPGELVNSFEFGATAERQIGSNKFALIAGSDRRPFDRITLRPRMMVRTIEMDISADLFGEKMFAPILVGPVADQKRFHPDGELATVKGASAAKAVMVVSSRASCPLEQIAAQAKTPLWYQDFPEADMGAVHARISKAVDLGCKVICITVGTPYQPEPGTPPAPSALATMGDPGIDWNSLERLRQGIRVPVILKGIMTAGEARQAIDHGFAGIVVSAYGGLLVRGMASPIEVLPSIADAVGGKVPLLIDGGFRRGTDILKALALGARAVMLGRPPMWGLAGYGADGVHALVKMLQTELARNMAMCGKPSLAALDPTLVALHRRGPQS